MADSPALTAILPPDRTTPDAVDLGHRVPALCPRDARLLRLGMELEELAKDHWQAQQQLPRERRRGCRLRFEVVLDVPPEPGRLGVASAAMPSGHTPVDG